MITSQSVLLNEFSIFLLKSTPGLVSVYNAQASFAHLNKIISVLVLDGGDSMLTFSQL